MTEVQTNTLEGLMRQQQSNGATGVIQGQEAVTLGPVEGGLIEVYCDGAIQLLEPEAAMTAVDDPGQQVGLLRGALLVVNQRRRDTQQEFRDVLERIRDYAIDKHESGAICRDGLDEFLSAFGLREYEG